MRIPSAGGGFCHCPKSVVTMQLPAPSPRIFSASCCGVKRPAPAYMPECVFGIDAKRDHAALLLYRSNAIRVSGNHAVDSPGTRRREKPRLPQLVRCARRQRHIVGSYDLQHFVNVLAQCPIVVVNRIPSPPQLPLPEVCAVCRHPDDLRSIRQRPAPHPG